jgi:hypothetical protein
MALRPAAREPRSSRTACDSRGRPRSGRVNAGALEPDRVSGHTCGSPITSCAPHRHPADAPLVARCSSRLLRLSRARSAANGQSRRVGLRYPSLEHPVDRHGRHPLSTLHPSSARGLSARSSRRRPATTTWFRGASAVTGSRDCAPVEAARIVGMRPGSLGRTSRRLHPPEGQLESPRPLDTSPCRRATSLDGVNDKMRSRHRGIVLVDVPEASAAPARGPPAGSAARDMCVEKDLGRGQPAKPAWSWRLPVPGMLSTPRGATVETPLQRRNGHRRTGIERTSRTSHRKG